MVDAVGFCFALLVGEILLLFAVVTQRVAVTERWSRGAQQCLALGTSRARNAIGLWNEVLTVCRGTGNDGVQHVNDGTQHVEQPRETALCAALR